MHLIFDIRTPDSAWEFVLNFFNIDGSEFIDKYIIQCNSSFDEFWERNLNYIDSVDIENLQYKVFHVTSNWDECAEIKASGIKNLQMVLSEENKLTTLVSKYRVKFDIDNKILIAGNKVIDIDYDKYRGRFGLSGYEKKIERVAHKIFYDFQVNGFFSNSDILGYGTEIHIRPEFLYNLTELLPHLKEVEEIWRNKSKGYIVTFLSDFNDFAWFSFYDNEYEYLDDGVSRQQLKKWMLSKAINRSFNGINDHSEIFAYINGVTIIKPEQIVDYLEIAVE